MSRIKFLACCMTCALAAGCAKPAESIEPTTNKAIEVELLFEKDGYRIHRFYDSGRPVYVVTPAGSVQSETTESCGKSCTRRVITQSITGSARP